MKDRKSNCAAKILSLGFLLVSLFYVSGCATAPVARIPTTVDTADDVLQDLCVRYSISCSLDSISQVITLKRKHVTARAIVGSESVAVEDKRVALTRPVRISRGVIYVPWDFKTKVMQPMFTKTSPFAQRFRKIMIDAGHGGKDPGGIGTVGTFEKDIVFDISRRLERALHDHGIATVMTRRSDEFIELAERARLAQQQGADLFISVHANIAKSQGVQGVEVYYLNTLDRRTKEEFFNPRNYDLYFRNLSMRQEDFQVKTILADMLYVNKQYESYRLAKYLAERLSRDLNTSNRGHKYSEFFVLKNTLIPAVLLELGFLSNPEEERKLRTNDYRQRIAESIVQALVDYVQYH